MDLNDFILKGNSGSKRLHLTSNELITPFLGVKGNKFGVGFLIKKNLDYFYGENISSTIDLFRAIKAVQIMECLSHVKIKSSEYCWKLSSPILVKNNFSKLISYLFPSGNWSPEQVSSLVKHLSPSTTFLVRALRLADRYKLEIDIDCAINELVLETNSVYQTFSLKDLIWGENTRFYTKDLDLWVIETSVKKQILKHLQKCRSLEKINDVITLAFTQSFTPLDIDGTRPLVYSPDRRRRIELISAKFEDGEFFLKVEVDTGLPAAFCCRRGGCRCAAPA
jgi:hypothetical protein